MAAAKPPAGYSGTPLWKKLGIKPGGTVLTVNAPPGYRDLLPGLPEGVSLVTDADPPLAFVHLFVTSASDLAARLPALMADLAPDGVIWVSWPKKASGVKTDVTEDGIRAAALPLGLVDVKVCAVDATWSGLKLVVRVANRNRLLSDIRRLLAREASVLWTTLLRQPVGNRRPLQAEYLDGTC
jgi:hypothetical protein